VTRARAAARTVGGGTARAAALVALALAGCRWTPVLPPALGPRPAAAEPPPAVARAATPPRRGRTTCPRNATRDVLARVNAARSAAGRRPLAPDTRLARVAAARAAAMARSGRLSHAGWERDLRDAGCKSRSLGENVASGYRTAGAVMEGWMRSRGHRANILEPRFASLGVGCAVDGGGTLWWTQDFAS
jgi:uncharacterized protein YkwD